MDEDSELPSIPWLIAVIQRISQWLVAKQLGGLSGGETYIWSIPSHHVTTPLQFYPVTSLCLHFLICSMSIFLPLSQRCVKYFKNMSECPERKILTNIKCMFPLGCYICKGKKKSLPTFYEYLIGRVGKHFCLE